LHRAGYRASGRIAENIQRFSMAVTEKEVVAFILTVLIVAIYSKFEDQIKGVFALLLIFVGALAALYCLVKFVRWSWYN